jgi:hypothetical protein
MVRCLFTGCGINAFRVASSHSSLAEKSCACAYITFLAGLFSWYADSTFKKHFDRKTLTTRYVSKNGSSCTGTRDGTTYSTGCGRSRLFPICGPHTAEWVSPHFLPEEARSVIQNVMLFFRVSFIHRRL